MYSKCCTFFGYRRWRFFLRNLWQGEWGWSIPRSFFDSSFSWPFRFRDWFTDFWRFGRFWLATFNVWFCQIKWTFRFLGSRLFLWFFPSWLWFLHCFFLGRFWLLFVGSSDFFWFDRLYSIVIGNWGRLCRRFGRWLSGWFFSFPASSFLGPFSSFPGFLLDLFRRFLPRFSFPCNRFGPWSLRSRTFQVNRFHSCRRFCLCVVQILFLPWTDPCSRLSRSWCSPRFLFSRFLRRFSRCWFCCQGRNLSSFSFDWGRVRRWVNVIELCHWFGQDNMG